MKIPIDISEKQLNKYLRLLFHYLERDKSFENAIIVKYPFFRSACLMLNNN